jgi:hypothetical protein
LVLYRKRASGSRTTSHAIAAASGKLGAFAGTYALTALLPAIGFARTSAIVAGVCVLGLLVTVTLLPEPKGLSLDELTEPGSGPPARVFHPVNPPAPSAPASRPTAG